MDAEKMDQLRVLVRELYHRRDHYFEDHPIDEAKNKEAFLHSQLEECLVQIDKLTESDDGTRTSFSSENRAEYLYLRGRALNLPAEYSKEAEELLAKAVKLDPCLVEAWNELGECYWKRGAVQEAKTCFEGAQRQRSNKVSLRSQSIVLRQLSAKTHEERIRNIEQGLSKAREAVQLDTSDGQSWSILGNAYFAHFFNISQNPRTLKQAMSAYKQAEKDVIAKSTPELHYNKGMALKFEEDYEGALASFKQAWLLDPTWADPKQQELSLLKTLSSIHMLLELKGKLKTKRFNSMVDSIDSKSIGPYQQRGGSSGLTEVAFSELCEGSNSGKVVLGKVICSVQSEKGVPFTFCLTDRTGRCLAVNLYNLSPGKGVIIGDSVAIPEPSFTKVNIARPEGKALSFDLIRVESPLTLVINGKKASQDLQAGIELSTFTKSD